MLAERLTAQLLSGPQPKSPEEAVGRLLAVQAQDARGARLSVRTRTTETTASDVDCALSAGSLLISWLNRGTLHLVRSEDYWWLHPLVTPQLVTGNVRRLREEGVSEEQTERGVDVIAGEVRERGPRTRAQLRAALDDAGVPTARQAFIHVVMAATLRGHLVRGPMRQGEHCFVDVEQWIGPAPAALERSVALARLAKRYLAGHGPADTRDVAKWAGIPLGDARKGLAGLAGELSEGPDGLVDLVARAPAAELPRPRLLGPFDPLLHGWTSREFIVGPHRHIVTTNGLFRAFALVRGRAVATWTLNSGQLTVRPLERIPGADLRALEADAQDVLRFLDLPAKRWVIER